MLDLSAIVTGTDDLCGVPTPVAQYYARQSVTNGVYKTWIPDFDWYPLFEETDDFSEVNIATGSGVRKAARA
jgi:hypothetical protein